MKKVAFVFGVLFWALAVFLGTFYLTFPSEAISLRLRYIIAERFDGYTADIGSVSPWWLGLSIDDVKLYREVSPSRSRPMEDEEGEEAPQEGAQLAAIFESVKVRVSPWSLLRRAPYVSGSVALPGGEVAFSVGSAVSGDGDIALSDLVVKAEQLPLEDLLALLPNASASGTGGIDIDIDLHAGSEGMKDATGHLSLTGAGLELSEVAPLPQHLARAEVVARHPFLFAALLLRDRATAHHTERAPAFAHTDAPQFAWRMRLPVGLEARIRQDTSAACAAKLGHVRCIRERGRIGLHFLGKGALRLGRPAPDVVR